MVNYLVFFVLSLKDSTAQSAVLQLYSFLQFTTWNVLVPPFGNLLSFIVDVFINWPLLTTHHISITVLFRCFCVFVFFFHFVFVLVFQYVYLETIEFLFHFSIEMRHLPYI